MRSDTNSRTVSRKSAGSRRRVVAIACVSAIALLVAGCTGARKIGTSDIGDTVKITGAVTGTEADALREAFIAFTNRTGIEVDYAGSDTFQRDVVSNVKAGSAPDVALVAGGGLLQDLVNTAEVVAPSEQVATEITNNWRSPFVDETRIAGVLYGVPVSTRIQNLVFYSPSALAKRSIEVPQSWSQLLAATATIREETQKAPWCVGFAGSPSAATSWIEGMYLRESGASDYQKWAAGDIAFTDTTVYSAFGAAEQIVREGGYVNGPFGRAASIATTTAHDAARALASGDCSFLLADSSLVSDMPQLKTKDDKDVSFGPQEDLFAFALPGKAEGDVAQYSDGVRNEPTPSPSPSEAAPTTASQTPTAAPIPPSQDASVLPVEVSATTAVALNNAQATQQVMAYLASAEFAEEFVKAGGLSTRTGVDSLHAPSDTISDFVALLQNDKTRVVFGASQQMPTPVALAFAEAMSKWVQGAQTSEVTAQIEAAKKPR